jgi:hypothetical protein
VISYTLPIIALIVTVVSLVMFQRATGQR